MRALFLPALAALSLHPLSAQLRDSYTDLTATPAVVDGVISPDEYGPGNEFVYFGGGSGFGGALGGATMYLKSSLDTLFIGFENVLFNASGSDRYVLYLRTGPGGFQTNGGLGDPDLGDVGRQNVSILSRDAVDTIAFPATHALIFGQPGWDAFFTLRAAGTSFDFSDTALARIVNTWEFAIPLSVLGVAGGTTIDFQMFLIGESGWLSDEGIPSLISATVNGGPLSGSPGWGTGNTHSFPDYNSFTINPQAVPEPAAAAAVLGFSVLGLLAIRRRR